MTPPPTDAPRVRRIEVRPKGEDPRARALEQQAKGVGIPLKSARTARVYLIEGRLSDSDEAMIRASLLADPVTETAGPGAAKAEPGCEVIEVHPLPGVMDPAAQSVREAIKDLIGIEPQVSTGVRYDLAGTTPAQATELANRVLANPVIHRVHHGAFLPDQLPRGKVYQFKLGHVEIRKLNDEQLAKLSREAHLFLSLDEMKAIQAEYMRLNREPTDIELETLAQTWSEHCVHKTLKSKIRYRGGGVSSDGVTKGFAADDKAESDPIRWTGRPGHTVNPDGSVTIDNLLKSTVAAATFELIEDGVDWTLSVFKDNSGVIAFDDQTAVCIKVETHNHPSAIEPYGGAATGAGGCIRDVIGTGLAAKPIANTDVFCVGNPSGWVQDSAVQPEITFEVTLDSAPVQIQGTIDRKPYYFRARHESWSLCIALRDGFDPADGPGSDGDSWWFETEFGAPYGKERSAASYMSIEVAKELIKRWGAIAAKSNWKLGVDELPPGTLHPRRILTDVVAGVRDYGNRMGIPTLNGAVYFDDRYVGNPLVFCGCIGVMPRDRIKGGAQPGDRIIAIGGRTGRDGIHGATFSSAELEGTSADEFSHAVQIGNAIEEKRVLDAILRARDDHPRPLFNGLTDCGAGGFSSAVGEMGSQLGAEVHLDRAPLKYDGLSYTEIWISEAQERMVLAVPPANVAALKQVCAEEGVELADLGHFGTPTKEIILNYKGQEVGRLDTHFLHDGIPQPVREAVWASRSGGVTKERSDGVQTPLKASDPDTSSLRHSITPSLLSLLSHPNIASKHWIIRQYDHEVQGNTLMKPLVGPASRGPGDAAMLEPVSGSGRGLAIACGLQTGIGDPEIGGDPYLMTLAAIDECVRNLVCVGADPSRIAILDNFCWPSCQKPENLGSLVRAAEGCYDGAKAYRTPFVSGKDSLNNQLKYTDPATGRERVIEIPPTLLITGMGIVPEVSRSVTMDAKRPGNVLIVVGPTTDELGGSHYSRIASSSVSQRVPRTDLSLGPRLARAVHDLIRAGLIQAAHDVSDGGLLTGIAEMLIASPDIGAAIDLARVHTDPIAAAFSESPSRYILEVAESDLRPIETALKGLFWMPVGRLNDSAKLTWPSQGVELRVEDLAAAWLKPLDW